MTQDLYFHSVHTSDRRWFLTVGIQKLLVLGGVILTGCTLPIRSFRTTDSKIVSVSLERFLELKRPGGILKIHHSQVGAIFLRHMKNGSFLALSAICTHQGCVVDVSNNGFRCPCHGSTYDANGQNTGGPAPRALFQFQTRLLGDTVQIFLMQKDRI